MHKLPPTPYSLEGGSGARIPLDLVSPVSNEHAVDTAIDAATGAAEYHYNFLDYFFRSTRGKIRARAYLDGIEKVSIDLPDGVPLDDQEVLAVLQYLSWRFGTIEVLDRDGYRTIDLDPVLTWEPQPRS